MPSNWIPYSHPDTIENNLPMINAGIEHAKGISNNILNKKYSNFDIKQIPFGFRLLGNTINILFRNFGLHGLKSMFRVYSTCNGCGICAQACPTKSIEIVNGKPKWSKTCEQCMRCVHICPQQSIYQLPASTKGKNRYFEPDFDPIKM